MPFTFKKFAYPDQIKQQQKLFCECFPEIIHETKGGLIYEENTPQALAKSLDQLLKNPNESKKMGISGRTAVLQKYSNKKLALSLVDNILAPALAKF